MNSTLTEAAQHVQIQTLSLQMLAGKMIALAHGKLGSSVPALELGAYRLVKPPWKGISIKVQHGTVCLKWHSVSNSAPNIAEGVEYCKMCLILMDASNLTERV